MRMMSRFKLIAKRSDPRNCGMKQSQTQNFHKPNPPKPLSRQIACPESTSGALVSIEELARRTSPQRTKGIRKKDQLSANDSE